MEAHQSAVIYKLDTHIPGEGGRGGGGLYDEDETTEEEEEGEEGEGRRTGGGLAEVRKGQQSGIYIMAPHV